MDTELHCNILKCRKSLLDKAVVTTCSHIFCVDCAQEKFRAAQLCPACDTTLAEPDDVVICSLQPTNDYKTSVLSGLSPSTILEICSRAMSFWQYQVHQESSFQQALLRNVNERIAHLSKQLENVIREANSELSLLNNKVTGLERDLELERRKTKDLSESLKDKDKEYQKLKNQYDRVKRKALLATVTGNEPHGNGTDNPMMEITNMNSQTRVRGSGLTINRGAVPGMSMGDVVNGMEANRIQRTPVRPLASGGFANNRIHPSNAWQQPQPQQPRPSHSHSFGGISQPRSHQQHGNSRSNYPDNAYYQASASDSEELEEILGGMNDSRQYGSIANGGANFMVGTGMNAMKGNMILDQGARRPNSSQRVLAPTTNRRSGSGGFRPAAFTNK